MDVMDYLADMYSRTDGPHTIIIDQTMVASFPVVLLPSDPYRLWYRIDGPTSGNASIQWDTQTNLNIQGFVTASTPYEQNFSMHAGTIGLPVYILIMPPSSFVRATYSRILPAHTNMLNAPQQIIEKSVNNLPAYPSIPEFTSPEQRVKYPKYWDLMRRILGR